jgi:hypothetical protein
MLFAVILTFFFNMPAKGQEIPEWLRITPSSSIASKGDTVRVSVLLRNDGTSDIAEGTLYLEAGMEFVVKDAQPLTTISGKTVSFGFQKLTPGETFRAWVDMEVVTNIKLNAHAMSVKSWITRDKYTVTARCTILLWAPTEYPPIEVELKEVSRDKGTIKFKLRVHGGYPPYEYYFDWGDGENGGIGDKKGGIGQEGDYDIEHVYLKPGEYHLNGFINDWLGKQSVIRRRLYIISWEDRQ